LSFGAETSSVLAPLATLVDSVAEAQVSSLSELVAAMGPYRPDVRLWVTATSAEANAVELSIEVDGKGVRTAPLTLTHDPRILTDDTVGGWLDLGELDESVAVALEVKNVADLSVVRSSILIEGCVVDGASDRCTTPGCVARSAVSVPPAVCLVN
jgi:hypothetical protein